MKYHLLVIGCQMNISDAERLENILQVFGASKTEQEKAADLIIVVSCSVRQKAMDRIYGRLRFWQKAKLKRKFTTVLTGCVLPADRRKLKEHFDIFLEIKDIEQLPTRLGWQPPDAVAGAVTNADYLALEPQRLSKLKAFVPIMTGCNNYCTFCAVPYTRGQEASRPASQIIKEVTGLIKKGYKEITLIGQNVNAYIDPEKIHRQSELQSRSRDFWKFRPDQPVQWRSATTRVPKDFAKLLISLDKLPGTFWLRFLTSNPQDVSDELIRTLPQCKKVVPYFHLPIQSGDNEILRRMNRRHTREYYLQLIKKIRQAWPEAAITTDVIVGFPGETKKHFLNTASLMKKVGYHMAYLAEYSPRPGTAAARFFKDDVPKKEKTRRKVALNKSLEASARLANKKLVGQTVPVLVERYDRITKVNYGKTDTGKDMRFIGKKKFGAFTQVKVIKSTAWHLSGKITE